jgi:hypothetical protein
MKYYMLVMVLWGLVGGITYRERREAGQGLRNRRSTSDDVIQVHSDSRSRNQKF